MKVAKPAAPHEGLCGAKKKQGPGHCRNVAGYKTDHVGIGRCFLHGGRTPARHGNSSLVLAKTPKLKELIAQHLANPDPLNTLPELAKARALADDFLERYEVFKAALIDWHESFRSNPGDTTQKPVQVMDIADATRILSEITKIVERIERTRAANAVSRADFLRVITEFGRVVDAYVKDEPTKMKIKESWLAIRVA